MDSVGLKVVVVSTAAEAIRISLRGALELEVAAVPDIPMQPIMWVFRPRLVGLAEAP